MKKLILLGLVCLFTSRLFAATFQIGDTISNKCWTTETGAQFCLDDAKDTVRVLLFNAGWCPPCRSEFSELVPRVSEFGHQPVTFISLSAQGWHHGEVPNATFLQSWKERYGIPFVTAASPNNFGSDFTDEPYIPNVAIINARGVLVYSGTAPGVDATFEQIRKAL